MHMDIQSETASFDKICKVSSDFNMSGELLNLSGNFLCLPCMSEDIMNVYFPMIFFFYMMCVYKEVHGWFLDFVFFFPPFEIFIHVHILIFSCTWFISELLILNRCLFYLTQYDSSVIDDAMGSFRSIEFFKNIQPGEIK